MTSHLQTAIPQPPFDFPTALPGDGPTDAELLARFLSGRDKSAFEYLVWRHGSLVLRVCRRTLHDPHAAEDAFQATFLTLACKARSIGKQDSLGSWLYKVAYRIALRMRSVSAKRALHEKPLGDGLLEAAAAAPGDESAWRELGPIIDAEVRRLPEKYREAFVLCYIEGKTNEEAAEELGCPKGTILSRLARARERLRERLNRRGLAICSAVLAALLLDGRWASAAGWVVERQRQAEAAAGRAAEAVRPERGPAGDRHRGRLKRGLLLLALLLFFAGGAGLWASGKLFAWQVAGAVFGVTDPAATDEPIGRCHPRPTAP